MSKLSVHISGGATGLDTLLEQSYQNNSPVGIIYSLNNNIKDSIIRKSPSTKWIYRRQTDTFNRLPDNFFLGDPVQSAVNWLVGTKDRADKWRTQLENWALNPADWFDPLNEPVIEIQDESDPAQVAEAIRRAEWLNAWMVTALEISYARGFKLALFSFASESGSLHPLVWKRLVPSFILGKKYGAILSLHAYGIDGELINRPSAFNRHTDIYNIKYNGEYVIPLDCRLPVVYSECGAGNGYNTGLNGQPYVNDLAQVDQYWMNDPLVLGGCSFQLGRGVESDMSDIMNIYTDYIASHPTPVTPPEPINDRIVKIVPVDNIPFKIVVKEHYYDPQTVYILVPKGFKVLN